MSMIIVHDRRFRVFYSGPKSSLLPGCMSVLAKCVGICDFSYLAHFIIFLCWWVVLVPSVFFARSRISLREWEATLKPWASRVDNGRGVPFEIGTKAQFKSDAKKAFGLTNKEIASLPYMGFAGSGKTIYRLTDCKAIADRKRKALRMDAFDYPAREIMAPTQPKAIWGLSLANFLGEPDHTLTVKGTSLTSLSGRREGYGMGCTDRMAAVAIERRDLHVSSTVTLSPTS
ncbi:hypothetical protein DAEQUDRAFT_810357 [Daedalea quercina L-15889]|uniref:Uncharacterized protein n=1 Tax=Daedalea quercina L-15889 TaxID=1314783 RepID=A0A165RHE1_9APHY|nr:hypothetical protein DAEQUDRAFT_810357 [Daedalea quercina L-15889]